MSAEWLLHDGRPIADSTVLSHPEQLVRLTMSCPQAAPTALLGGDPCFDRILDALPHRDRYRADFGLTRGQQLVVINSTWNPGALFGDAHDILPWLLDEVCGRFPLDQYRIAAVLHPNIWYGHGPGQVRAWLDRAVRAGLLLVPPLDGWRQALVAADCLIGDHGSVSYYAAAIGVPVLLAAFPDADLDPDSPVAAFGRRADRLQFRQPLQPQIDRAIHWHQPERAAWLAKWVTSDPGRSAALLRRHFYHVLDLPEPDHPAHLDGLAVPPVRFASPTAPVRILLSAPDAVADPRRRRLEAVRLPESADRDALPSADVGYLAVIEDTTDLAALRRADLVLTDACESAAAAFRWFSRSGRRYPYAAMTAACTGPGRAIVRYRDGRMYRLRCIDCDCDAVAALGALLSLLDHSLFRGDGPQAAEPFEIGVGCGPTVHTARITPLNRHTIGP